MNASRKDVPEMISEQDFDQALEGLRTLFPRDEIAARQASGANAVYTPLVTVWLMVRQRLQAGLSLQDAVTELLDHVQQFAPHNKRVRDGNLSANTGAYSRARKRLSADLLNWTADHMFNSLVAATPPSVAGRRVFIFDGTTITLLPAPDLKRAYPPAVNQHGTSVWPVVQLVVAHELASGCATLPEWGPMYGDEAVGEVTLAKRIIPRLPAKSLLIADRGFGIFGILFTAVQHKHDILLRLTDTRFKALQRRATLIETTATSRCWQLDWAPSAWDRKTHPEIPRNTRISVWLHEIQISETYTLRLVCTLDSSPELMAKLYHRRGDIETDIRDVKVTMNMENLAIRDKEMLRKEIAASLIAYNLVIQIRRLAAKAVNVPARRLSFTGTWSAVKIILLAPHNWTARKWRQKFELVLRITGQRKIPNRPGRSFPRKAHRKCPKSRSGKKSSKQKSPM